MTVRSNLIDSSAYITGVHRIHSNAFITATKRSIKSDAIIKVEYESELCDGSIVDDIFDDFGTNVLLRDITKTFNDEYGDAVETYKDYTIPAVITSYTSTDEDVKEGIFKAGEMIFSFPREYEIRIKTGNKIKYGSFWYEIKDVIQQPTLGVLYYLQARVQKI